MSSAWSISTDPRITDDLIAHRDEAGRVLVRLSPWLRPAQRLVMLAWIGELLDAEPRTAVAVRMSAGGVLGQTATIAGRELADLMDDEAPSVAQQARAVELICVGR